MIAVSQLKTYRIPITQVIIVDTNKYSITTLISKIIVIKIIAAIIKGKGTVLVTES
jgi:hypothetical protein